MDLSIIFNHPYIKIIMRSIICIAMIILFFCLSKCGSCYAQSQEDYFKIRVVDQATGRGVPMVEVRTVNSIRYITDNNGIIAFYEPGLMDQKVYFHVKGHGYAYPKDGFGYRGLSCQVKGGDSLLIEIERTNIAERIYRITGQGLYHHSVLVGHPAPIREQKVNAQVTGQDWGHAIPYKNKIYWFWGDTNKAAHPLGNFSVSGATSQWPEQGGLDPDVGIKFSYFVDKSGFSKPMIPASEVSGSGPVWGSSYMTLKDEKGIERLVAIYECMKNPAEPYEKGLAVFNDETETFQHLAQFDLDKPIRCIGSTFRVKVEEQDYYYFAELYPRSTFVRVKADWQHATNPDAYEAFTCLNAGSKYDKSSPSLDRAPDGRLIYSWKTNTEPIGYEHEQELIKAGHIKPGEAWFHLQDIHSGEAIRAYSGSVHWNDFRKRWVMIVQQSVGKVFYAEGDTPVGPWTYAKKIVDHKRYTFYLPTHHPFFDREGGSLIYFEGTYTNMFSGNPDRTPRYDYNQIMYRLDLKDPRLYLPVPVYRVTAKGEPATYLTREGIAAQDFWPVVHSIPFFALPKDRKPDRSVPVYRQKIKGKYRLTTNAGGSKSKTGDLLFYGLPDLNQREKQISGIWECKADGYPLALNLQLKGHTLEGKVINRESSLRYKKGSLSGELVEVSLQDTLESISYTLTMEWKDGRLNGTFAGGENNHSGSISCECSNDIQALFSSPRVVALYEYYDPEKKEYFYSTRSGWNGVERSEKPVCYVWENPSSSLILDDETEAGAGY